MLLFSKTIFSTFCSSLSDLLHGQGLVVVVDPDGALLLGDVVGEDGVHDDHYQVLVVVRDVASLTSVHVLWKLQKIDRSEKSRSFYVENLMLLNRHVLKSIR